MALAPRTVQNMPDCLSPDNRFYTQLRPTIRHNLIRAYKGEIPANPAAKASRNGETSASSV
jgi:hypothetical protein